VRICRRGPSGSRMRRSSPRVSERVTALQALDLATDPRGDGTFGYRQVERPGRAAAFGQPASRQAKVGPSGSAGASDAQEPGLLRECWDRSSQTSSGADSLRLGGETTHWRCRLPSPRRRDEAPNPWQVPAWSSDHNGASRPSLFGEVAGSGIESPGGDQAQGSIGRSVGGNAGGFATDFVTEESPEAERSVEGRGPKRGNTGGLTAGSQEQR
jgi:hypothetical protein